MWNAIISAYEPNGNKSVILTTHSMEEVDALCTKMAIIAKGQMQCLGTIQHLNDKYGTGYILEIKWRESSPVINLIVITNLVKDLFPNMNVIENVNNLVKINIPHEDIKSFAVIFQTFEEWKRDHPDIKELGMSQSSIEQVFLEFAKSQEIYDQEKESAKKRK